jgi:hypothetical protein
MSELSSVNPFALTEPEEIQAVVSEDLDPGQDEENHVTETEPESSDTEQAPVENESEKEIHNDVEEHSEDDKKWIGKRLERVKAKEREAAQVEIDYWKAEARKNQQYNQVQPQQNSNASQNKPTPAQYTTIEEYTEAIADWKFDQRLAQQNANTARQQAIKSYGEKVAAFQVNNPDFQTVVNNLIKDYQNENVPELMQYVNESDVGAEITYYIAKNPHIMEKIIEMPSHRRYAELGKLEDKVSNKNMKSYTANVSKAPNPVKPEKGSAVVKGKDLNDPDWEQKAYREARLASRKRK